MAPKIIVLYKNIHFYSGGREDTKNLSKLFWLFTPPQFSLELNVINEKIKKNILEKVSFHILGSSQSENIPFPESENIFFKKFCI